MKTAERDEYFSDPARSVDDKYLAWKAIDMVHRYNMQQKAFDDAAKEKNKTNNRTKEAHSNLMTLLIAQIERPIEEDIEKNLFNYAILNKIAQPVDYKKRAKEERDRKTESS